MKRTILLLLFFISFCSSISVLIVHAAPIAYAQDVQRKLSTYFNTTLYAANTNTPALSDLLGYDVAFVFSDYSFINPTLLGNNLASYVDAGRGVVLGMFDFVSASVGEQVGGRFTSYMAIVPGIEKSFSQSTLVALEPGHPILNGVRSFNGGSSSYRAGTFHPSADKVAQWNDALPLIGTRTFNGTRRVDLNFYPPSSDARSDFWLSSTDGVLIMANSIRWVAATSCSNLRNCLACTNGGCQWCLDTDLCSVPDLNCEDRISHPTFCPRSCTSFPSCDTCVDPSNAGACTWCLNSHSCIPHSADHSCTDVINHHQFCT